MHQAIRSARAVLAALVGAMLLLPVWARTVEGHVYDEQITLGGQPLVLNGAGVRQVVWFKGFTVGLWVPRRSGEASQLMSQDGAKRLRMALLVDNISSEELVKALQGGVVKRVGEADRERTRGTHARIVAEPERVHRFEFRALTARGTARWFESTARAVTDDQGMVTTIVTIIRDLSQRKAREADLERQATTDSMTGVLNRRAFQKRLADIPREEFGNTGVLALLDLDHFKQVNDTHGHDVGDEALKAVANCLRTMTRYHDVVARLCGEEVAVVTKTNGGGEVGVEGVLAGILQPVNMNVALIRTAISLLFIISSSP